MTSRDKAQLRATGFDPKALCAISFLLVRHFFHREEDGPSVWIASTQQFATAVFAAANSASVSGCFFT
jgi:hypothetical protein